MWNTTVKCIAVKRPCGLLRLLSNPQLSVLKKRKEFKVLGGMKYKRSRVDEGAEGCHPLHGGRHRYNKTRLLRAGEREGVENRCPLVQYRPLCFILKSIKKITQRPAWIIWVDNVKGRSVMADNWFDPPPQPPTFQLPSSKPKYVLRYMNVTVLFVVIDDRFVLCCIRRSFSSFQHLKRRRPSRVSNTVKNRRFKL